MRFETFSRWRHAARYRRLLRVLVERYGRTDWYTEGQVETAIRLSNQETLLNEALCVLTCAEKQDRVLNRERFSSVFFKGWMRFNARHVVDRFLGTSATGTGPNNPAEPNWTMISGG